MKISNIKCPSCGGSIKADLKNTKHIFCTYCGQQLYIDDGKKEEIHTYNFNINTKSENIEKTIDLAKIEEEKTIQKTIKMFIIAIIIFLVMGLLIFYDVTFSDSVKKYINEKNGKVCVGSASSFIDEDYEYVKATIESAGFTNITLIDLHPNGAVKDDGKVTKISIGGNSSFYYDEYFSKDSAVVIAYN